MLYLLDANVPITACNHYYPLSRIPQYWAWLVAMGEAGKIKIHEKIYSEIVKGNDDLVDWCKDYKVRQSLEFKDPISPGSLQKVLSSGYEISLDDPKMELTGRDPFLIAAALQGPKRTVVTKEISSPKKIGVNRKIPDVCKKLEIPCITDFQLYKTLDFTLHCPKCFPTKCQPTSKEHEKA